MFTGIGAPRSFQIKIWFLESNQIVREMNRIIYQHHNLIKHSAINKILFD